MEENQLNFVGVSSGDHESHCWDVSAAEFERLFGRRPTVFERSLFNDGLYRYYPRHGIGLYEVSISQKKISDGPEKTRWRFEDEDRSDLTDPDLAASWLGESLSDSPRFIGVGVGKDGEETILIAYADDPEVVQRLQKTLDEMGDWEGYRLKAELMTQVDVS